MCESEYLSTSFAAVLRQIRHTPSPKGMNVFGQAQNEATARGGNKMRLKLWIFIGLAALALTACGQALGAPAAEVAEVASPTLEEETATDTVVTATAEVPAATQAPPATEVVPTATQAPTATARPAIAEKVTPDASPTPEAENDESSSASDPESDEPKLLPEEPPPSGSGQFLTDFSKHIVPYNEILSGGPPKDGIPAIDDPQFVGVTEADSWLRPQEPVILFEVGDKARAYPIQILMWHEIVNDTVGDTAVTVTFCPLCNTAIAFDRTLDGQVLDFGTTGRLRFSNLVMYDRQTETWWQQATGEAIAGEHTGRQLRFLPTAMISWEDFKTAHPDGTVLSRETGFSRGYGRNPYAGYDDINQTPFLYRGSPETPGVLPAMARVLTVELGREAVAYPYQVMQEVHVANDRVGGLDLVVFWNAGTASALDANSVADGRDVGAANAFARELDGQTLTFSFGGDKIIDDETGSEWDVLGRAISGPLEGSQLNPVVGVNHFWFSWAAFKPETRVYESSS
jgi:hypothetical protein